MRFVMSLVCTFGTFANAAIPSVTEIMSRNEEARKIKSMHADAKLITTQNESDNTKEFEWWRKLTTDNVHFHTLTRFQKPAEVKGESILFREKSAGESDVQLYLPAYKKIRRVESQQQKGSFMGSEFSYTDMAPPKADDYKYKYLRQEACPNEPGVQCYVVEAAPTSEKVLESTGTSKIVKWIRLDNFIDSKAEYWNEDGELWKRLEASQIKKVDANKWLAHSIKMQNLKKGRTTILEFANVKVNQNIPDSTFSDQNLSHEK